MILNLKSGKTKSFSQAFSLVEILIAVFIVACSMGAILVITVSGRKTTEYEVRYLQALTIAQTVNSELERASICPLASLPSEPEMLPLVDIGSEKPSSYGLRLFQDRANVAVKFPDLAKQLNNFRISVILSPFDDLEENRAVEIVVYFRLSAAETNWHRLTVNSVIVQRSPI